MSYPSIHKHLEAKGVALESANDAELAEAFLAAFAEDLPLGWAKVNELVAKHQTRKANGEERAMLSLDPKSPEGQQYARLLGPDIPRKILEEHFGVAFGFYNCCGGIIADDQKKLRMTLREQIESQHPNFVDC